MRRIVACLLLLVTVGCGSSWTGLDADGDGFTLAEGDCDDGPSGAGISPGSAEVWYDGVDQDCDGNDGDQDGDGEPYIDAGGADCWDDPTKTPEDFVALNGFVQPEAADVLPGASEVWYDGVDQDCDGADDFDQDEDGFASMAWGETRTTLPVEDCFDALEDVYPESWAECVVEAERVVEVPLSPSAVHPGAEDTWYDGTDANCDGADDWDKDADGFAKCEECDDERDDIFPNDAEELWYNHIDENCDGNDADKDGDGYIEAGYEEANPGDPIHAEGAFGLDDCWDDPDAMPTDFDAINGEPQPDAADVHPDAEEGWYDGVDQDCADDDDFDQDGDGDATEDYPGRSGFYGEDCDDLDGTINSNAAETWYDGVDQDCAGDSDYDQDHDGYDSSSYSYGTKDDCDDEKNEVHPSKSWDPVNEDCGTTYDDDCDGGTNDDDAIACIDFYDDADLDSYGDIADTRCLCIAEDTYTETGVTASNDDCDDADPLDYPAAAESVNNGDDEDCDGVDSCYTDNDLDAFGSATVKDSNDLDCTDSGEADDDDDCDDTDEDTFPGAAETESATACMNDDDADGYGDATTSASYTEGSDLDDDKSTCTTSLADTDGDGYYDCQDRCGDTDGDNYGTTNTTAASCLDASGASCSGDAACTSTDVNDAMSTCTTSSTYIDTDGDGYYNCQDRCADVDGDNYGTTSTTAASCVTNGASGGTTSCAGDAACTSTDVNDAMSTCTTSATYVDSDGDGYYNCQDQCSDVDGDNYGTTSSSAAACVTNGASGGTTTCAADAACTSTDLDDAKSTCTTSLTDTDGDGYYNCQDQCSDVDGDNYGTTSAAAALCVTNGASGGTTTCAADAACTSTDVNDAMSTCTTSGTYADTDGDGYYNCQDQCSDVDGDNYGTTSAAAALCVTNGASGGTTTCAADAACTSTDVNDAMSTCTTSGTYIDTDGDGYYDCQDRCADVDGDNYGTTSSSAANCVTNGASGGTTTCAGDAACTSTDLDDAKSTCTTSLADTDGDGYYNCQDQCSDVDGDNYGTTSTAAASCVTNGASGGTTTCAADAACTSTDVNDAMSTCTTSGTYVDSDGDGYYNCQDQCSDVDGDNYGTTSSSAASCVTNGASGGTTTCAGDSACTSTDVDDAKSTCTTSLTDTDGDGYYNCQDLCADTDGDNYGTTNSSASSCVTNGAAGGTNSCAADAACTSTDVNDAMSTCTTSATYIDTDGDGYYNCQDQCADVDGDNYGTTSSSAASCVTNGASGGTTTCAGDAACTSTDVDDAKSTCTTSLTDTDSDGYYNCQDQCSDVDGDNYGTTSSAAAACVTNGASGGTTTCAADAACTSTDVNDAMSTCTTSATYIDTDGDGYYDCQDRCADVDGDNYGTTSSAAASCVTNGASGGTTTCAGDAACTSTDVNDAMSTCTTSATYIDTDGDAYYDCQDRCADVDGDDYGTTSTAAASCVTNGASGGSTSCAGDAACTSTDVDDAKSTCTTSTTDTDGDGYYNCQDQCADTDGDNYGTTSTAAALCVTNGASGGTTTCAADAACTATDLDDAKSTCTTSLADTDGDGVYNCQDQCADTDGDNYGTTSSAAAACVTNGASGGSTSCAGDSACTSTDVNDAMSTCTTAGTYIDTDGDTYYDCQDRCADSDGDNYGTTSTAAASCVTNGASGGTTTCAADAACSGTDCDDTDAAVYPSAADTFATNDGVDNDCDDFIDESGVAFGDMVITEFFGGNTTYTHDWIEIYNNSGDTMSLSSWTMELCVEADTAVALPYDETDCDSWVTVTFPSTATVADDTYYVVCGASSVFTTPADCDIVITSYDSPAYTTSTDLENALGGASLELDGTVIDDVYWWQENGNDDWPADASTAINAQLTSIQLDLDTINAVSPDPADTNDDYTTSTSNPYLDDIWCTAEDALVTNDWSASFTIVGTPGAVNVACP